MPKTTMYDESFLPRSTPITRWQGSQQIVRNPLRPIPPPVDVEMAASTDEEADTSPSNYYDSRQSVGHSFKSKRHRPSRKSEPLASHSTGNVLSPVINNPDEWMNLINGFGKTLNGQTRQLMQEAENHRRLQAEKLKRREGQSMQRTDSGKWKGKERAASYSELSFHSSRTEMDHSGNNDVCVAPVASEISNFYPQMSSTPRGDAPSYSHHRRSFSTAFSETPTVPDLVATPSPSQDTSVQTSYPHTPTDSMDIDVSTVDMQVDMTRLSPVPVIPAKPPSLPKPRFTGNNLHPLLVQQQQEREAARTTKHRQSTVHAPQTSIPSKSPPPPAKPAASQASPRPVALGMTRTRTPTSSSNKSGGLQSQYRCPLPGGTQKAAKSERTSHQQQPQRRSSGFKPVAHASGQFAAGRAPKAAAGGPAPKPFSLTAGKPASNALSKAAPAPAPRDPPSSPDKDADSSFNFSIDDISSSEILAAVLEAERKVAEAERAGKP